MVPCNAGEGGNSNNGREHSVPESLMEGVRLQETLWRELGSEPQSTGTAMTPQCADLKKRGRPVSLQAGSGC